MATPTHLFRIFAGLDINGNLTLYRKIYEVLRETPKGYKILKHKYDEKETFVRSNGKNRFAYPTEKEALVNFHYRKKRELAFCLAARDRLNKRIDRVRNLFQKSNTMTAEVLDIPKGEYVNIL